MGRYEVWCPELGQESEDGLKISAFDEKSAAEEWAEWSDARSADYSIVGGEDADVMVRDLDTRAVYAFRVSGESIPRYSARDISYQSKT